MVLSKGNIQNDFKVYRLSIHDNQIEREYMEIEFDIYDRIKTEKSLKYVCG